jgi:hypothetical protein
MFQEVALPIYINISQYTQDELDILSKKCLELHYKYGLGVCMTKPIHKEFHILYGLKNNTPEQYEEFKKNKLIELVNRNKKEV